MKKQIMIAITLLALASCSPSFNESDKKEKVGDFTIKTIDSCEYIEFNDGIFDKRVYSLTHKGNCKYCLLRKSKQ